MRSHNHDRFRQHCASVNLDSLLCEDVKLMSAIPMHWIGEIPISDELFWVSKERAKELSI